MPKLLIVEDDDTLRTVYGILTKKAGYEVKLANNGQVGLDELETFQPDVVLLDMLMPVKSGIELLEEAKVKKNYPKTSVIVLSNLSDSEVITKALKLGAVKNLVKSNTPPKDLLAAIKKYC